MDLSKLTGEEWFLLGGLAMTIVLVCLAAAVYFAPRPPLDPDELPVAIGRADDTGPILLRPAAHSQEDRMLKTQNLGRFPSKIFPDGE